HPKHFDMLMEAMTSLNKRIGVTVPALKNYITNEHTSVDINRLKIGLKKALEKGVEEGRIVRAGS
ncbi:hypothetical protein CAPTEDRAFT_80204, partial [Capitella teleta]